VAIVCTPGTCGDGGGTVGPESGEWWAWLGGVSGPAEDASVSQSATIPVAGTATLHFGLWNGASSGNGADKFSVSIDGDSQFLVHEGNPDYTGGYASVDLDVSQFADGASHALKLEAQSQAGSAVTSFSLDDVSLDWCPLPLPSLSVGDASVTEGNTGTKNAVFTVTLSPASATVVSVSYATGVAATGVPATAGTDYTAVSGSLSFAVGATTASVPVPVLGDTNDEPDETFALNLSAPVNAVLADATGVGTIVNDDSPPSLSIDDVTVVEGDSGTTDAVFTVSLSSVSSFDASVAYATADGTALAGLDYTATSGTLTIPAGTSSATLTVPVLGDTLDESDETFSLLLSIPVNATILDGLGKGTIQDDDGPLVSVGDATATEGDSGSVPLAFQVTLSQQSPQAINVSYSVADGTATAGQDYVAVSGTLSFPPGATNQKILVPILGDILPEPNETFFVVLGAAVNARVGDGLGLGTIVDNDAGAPELAGELVHGSVVRADLAALPGPTPDRDVYLLERPPHSSFEIVVDGTSGDIGNGNGPLVQRLAADLSTVLQQSVPAGAGASRSMRMENALGVPVVDYIRVQSAGCSLDCDAADVYRIRAVETTVSLARFNQTATQTTTLVLANTSAATVSGHVWFWDADGALLGSSSFGLGGRHTLVLSAASVPGVPGHSGSITVSHDAPDGALAGKAVSIEPATGFTFDTSLLPRVR
jgi:hypothetical protein